MNTPLQTPNDDEISLTDIKNFLCQQQRLLLGSFILLFGIVTAYVLALPTLYEVKGSIQIGERFFFTQLQQSSNPAPVTLIESPEQIKYRFPNVNITPIKNTRVIEITAKREHAADAQAAVANTLQNILATHAETLQSKRSEFLRFLEITRSSNKEMIELIDVAATSVTTKPYTPMQTTALPYSGLLSKILGIGLIACVALSLGLTLVVDQLQRRQSNK